MIEVDNLDTSAKFLLRHRRADSGLIHAFDSAGSHGASIDFITGFAATMLLELENPIISEEDLIATANSLLERQTPEGGWSYNNDTFAVDSDSAAWVLSFIADLAVSGQIEVDSIESSLNNAVSFLLSHQDESGGFITFTDQNLRKSDLITGIPNHEELDLSGWSGPNPECTASSCLALLKAQKLGIDLPDEVFAQADDYLSSQIRPDGSVDTYWYTDDTYATALTAEYLLMRDKGDLAVGSLDWLESRLPDMVNDPLYLSMACRTLLQFKKGSPELEEGISHLQHLKKGDHWETNEKFWTFPAFNYHSGSGEDKGIFKRKDDPQHVFVTSFAMAAMNEASKFEN